MHALSPYQGSIESTLNFIQSPLSILRFMNSLNEDQNLQEEKKQLLHYEYFFQVSSKNFLLQFDQTWSKSMNNQYECQIYLDWS